MLRRLQMQAVQRTRTGVKLAVQKSAAVGLSNLPVEFRELKGFFRGPRKLVGKRRQMGEVSDRRRGDEKDLRRLFLGTGFTALDDFDKGLDSQGDIACGQSKPGFEVVGPEHHDNKIQGLMRFQAGLEIDPAISRALQWIVVHGGSATLPLLNDMESGPQVVPQNPGPSHGVRVPDGCGALGGGDRVPAPGVGVAETEDGLHKKRNLHGRCRAEPQTSDA